MNREFLLTSKFGYKIQCRENSIENPKEVIIFVHGFGGSKYSDSIQKQEAYFVPNHYVIIAYDAIACGQSEVHSEEMRMEKVIADLDEVVIYAKKTYAGLPINLFGNSFGSYTILVYLATLNHSEFHKIMLKSPAIDMLGILEKCKNIKFKKMKPEDTISFSSKDQSTLKYEFVQDLQKFNVYELYKKFNYPVNIVSGDSDGLVSLASIKKFASVNKPTKTKIVIGAEHSFNDNQSIQLNREIVQILSEP